MAGIDANTKLILHGNGVNGSFEVLDSSDAYSGATRARHTFTQAGTAVLSTTQKKFGSTSLSVDGNSDYVTCANSKDWEFPADFVVELFVYPTVDQNSYIIGKYTASAGVWMIQWTATDKIFWYYGNGTAYSFGDVDMTTYLNTWCHIAIARSSGTTRCYFNGTQLGSDQADANTYTSTNALYVGTGGPIGSVYFGGYIDEVRISKETARGYTGATITVPTAAFTADSNTVLLLHMDTQDLCGLAGSTYKIPDYIGTAQIANTPVRRFGTASLLLDGDSDYVQIGTAGHVDWDLNNNTNYTIDFWFYPQSSGTTQYVVDNGTDTNNEWSIYISNAGAIGAFSISGGGTQWTADSAASTISFNEWHHVALIKVSGDIGVYLDGKQVADANTAVTTTFNAPLRIGVRNSSAFYTKGYIDEFRIYTTTNVFGAAPSAALTNTITVPSSPYTSDANTKLLLHFDDMMDSGNTNHYTDPIAYNGTAQHTGIARFGSGSYEASSLYFDGTNTSYVNYPDSDQWHRDSPWTIDMWLKPVALEPSTSYINLCGQGSDVQANAWRFNIDGSGGANDAATLIFNTMAGTTITFTFNSPRVSGLNRWYHIALSRSGNDYYFFVNGVQKGGTQTNATAHNDAPYPFEVGRVPGGGGWRYSQKYIDCFRWRNVATTANFTPPTTPPSSDGNTHILLQGELDARDGSSYNRTPTYGGAGFAVSGTRIFGAGSMQFDGDSDWIEFADSADWRLGGGTGNFCVDFWLKPTTDWNNGTEHVICGQAETLNNEWNIEVYNSGFIRFWYYPGSTEVSLASGSAYAWQAGVWYHLAVIRGWNGNANDYALTINGSAVATTTNANTLSDLAKKMYIGSGFHSSGSQRYVDGLIEEFRLSNVARWTTTFTPPTTEYTYDAGPAGISKVNSVSMSNINRVNSVLKTNIAKISSRS